MATGFKPDYRHVLDAAWNRKPRRLRLYELMLDVWRREGSSP
jgi:hypothetical protein